MAKKIIKQLKNSSSKMTLDKLALITQQGFVSSRKETDEKN